MSDGVCLATGCTARRRKGHIFCKPHWDLVSKDRQRRIRTAAEHKADPKVFGVLMAEIRGAIRDLAEWEGRA